MKKKNLITGLYNLKERDLKNAYLQKCHSWNRGIHQWKETEFSEFNLKFGLPI